MTGLSFHVVLERFSAGTISASSFANGSPNQENDTVITSKNGIDAVKGALSQVVLEPAACASLCKSAGCP